MPLREMIAFAAERMMKLEIVSRTGAEWGEKSKDRQEQRNGYCERDWGTRAGTDLPPIWWTPMLAFASFGGVLDRHTSSGVSRGVQAGGG